MSERGFEIEAEEGQPVALPSGATFYVQTDSEKEYVEERVEKYLSHNHFTNISDFQDIDKMVTFELFMHRWSLWLSKGMDYFGNAVDEKSLARQINEFATEMRQLKKNIGIDKVSRDRQRGDDSVAAYLDKLKQRAKEFGITRNQQASKSIELFQELKALITFHDNADEIERAENHVKVDDILDWIRETAIPEFDKIDSEFRKTQQKMWIREM